jgi:hypothetical protein
MKTFLKGAVAALVLASATVGAANAAVSFYVGPDGARVGYTQGSYYDRLHHRHVYTYPNDWRTYHHPMDWYRTHNEWYHDRDWYRR